MKRLIGSTIVACILIPSLSSAITLDRSLSIGSRGEDVTAVQQVLSTLGFFQEEATGYFGRITSAAVALFQTANNLEPVGSVGPKTRALINAILAGAPTATPSASVAAAPASSTPAETTSLSEPATTTPPVAPAAEEFTVTIITPSTLPADTREMIFTVATNKNATCRFGTTPYNDFPRKTGFKNTGTTSHTHEFVNLQNGALYVYFVQCEDTATLKLTPEVTVSISVANRVSTLLGMPSQLASALTSIASMGPWSLMMPVQRILSAAGF